MRRLASIALAIAGSASCGVRASDSGGPVHPDVPDAATVDGGAGDAAPIAPDAPPPPCVEGDARTTVNGSCIAVFTSVTALRADAITACASHGMHLAYVTSADIESAIATLAGTHVVAIGADDLAVEGQFVWGDGTPVGPYTAWATGEPNNGNGQYEEDCAVFAGNKIPPGWDDKPCAPPPAGTGAYGYVCQR